MTFLDFFIIYLSLGAPFGAYRLVRNGKPIGPIGLFSAAMEFLLWPPFAIRYTFRYLGPDGNTVFEADDRPDAKLFERIETLSDEFSNLAGRSHRLVARQAKQKFERYAELSLALMTNTATWNGQYFELLTVSGHPAPKSGSACLNRRNRNVIERHLKDARKELMAALDDLSEGRPEAIEVFEKTADLFADAELKTALEASLKNFPRLRINTRLNQWETSKPQRESI